MIAGMGPCGDADHCLFADEDGVALLAAAYPAGRYQAEIQRLLAEHHAWLRDADGDDPFPPTDDSPPPAVRDEEFRKALRARAVLGCRALAAEHLAALLPAALAVLRLARIGTLDQDLGPFLTAAFPRPFRGGDTLSAAQHSFVAALTGREELHRGATSRPWYRRTGLPLGLDECRALCSAR